MSQLRNNPVKLITTLVLEFIRKNPTMARFFGILLLFIIPGFTFEIIGRYNHGVKLMIGNSKLIYDISYLLILATKHFLVLLGYQPVVVFSTTFYNYNVFLLHIIGGGEVFIGVPCLGLGLMGVYTALIVAFPGKLKSKLIFIPAGILLIIILNILRISFLAIMLYYYPNQDNLSQTFAGFMVTYHHKLFNYGVLLIIFGIFITWVNFFSGYNEKKKKA
jgi:exosortase/archaeosortase family protein